MLTPLETRRTRKELQENYRRLNEPEDQVLKDLRMSREELHAVLNMSGAYPGDVWKVRDYLEDKMNEYGIEMVPWSRLADHSANHWYSYDTPWRN